ILIPADRRPSAFGTDPGVHLAVWVPELFARPGIGLCDVPRRVRTHREAFPAILRQSVVVEIDICTQPSRTAADDGEHEIHPVATSAHDRLRTAAHADPGGEPSRFGRRKHP